MPSSNNTRKFGANGHSHFTSSCALHVVSNDGSK